MLSGKIRNIWIHMLTTGGQLLMNMHTFGEGGLFSFHLFLAAMHILFALSYVAAELVSNVYVC